MAVERPVAAHTDAEFAQQAGAAQLAPVVPNYAAVARSPPLPVIRLLRAAVEHSVAACIEADVPESAFNDDTAAESIPAAAQTITCAAISIIFSRCCHP